MADGVTVKDVLGDAYKVHRFQIEGLPKWAESDRFDIKAKADEDAPQIDFRHVDSTKMHMREELRRRMQLRLQALLADRFQLQLHSIMKEFPVYAIEQSKSGAKLSDAKTPDDLSTSGTHITDGNLVANNLTMQDFTNTLTGQTDRVVIDQTGLTGRYDFTMNWVPDDHHAGAASGSAPVGPSLFTALQEQLGLKLVPQKAPIEVLVVDRVERPSPN
jgi:uncharacterized protein (TIGR03435 family)